jgi:hypothetical protein
MHNTTFPPLSAADVAWNDDVDAALAAGVPLMDALNNATDRARTPRAVTAQARRVSRVATRRQLAEQTAAMGELWQQGTVDAELAERSAALDEVWSA